MCVSAEHTEHLLDASVAGLWNKTTVGRINTAPPLVEPAYMRVITCPHTSIRVLLCILADM